MSGQPMAMMGRYVLIAVAAAGSFPPVGEALRPDSGAGKIIIQKAWSNVNADSEFEAPPPAESQCAFEGVIDDVTYYEGFAKQFVGLNPRKGYGSGFYFKKDDFIDETYGRAPSSNGVESGKTRTDLCTCDCKASAGGVGCVGYGGIAFRYISTLASPGKECGGAWSGQMAAQDCGAAQGGRCNTTEGSNQAYFQFMGTDKRESPGGAVVYDVAATLALTNDGISGVFRQPNDPTSCAAGLKDKADFKAGDKAEKDSCYFKCGDEGIYSEWLDYCAAGTDSSEVTGFRGWEAETPAAPTSAPTEAPKKAGSYVSFPSAFAAMLVWFLSGIVF